MSSAARDPAFMVQNWPVLFFRSLVADGIQFKGYAGPAQEDPMLIRIDRAARAPLRCQIEGEINRLVDEGSLLP
jgi:hypothetical protein